METDFDLTIKPLCIQNTSHYYDFFEKSAFTDTPCICYCTQWNMSREDWIAQVERPLQNHEIKSAEAHQKCIRQTAERLIFQDKLHGYLAYMNDIPVGWCNAGGKESYQFLGRHVTESGISKDVSERVKSIVCIEVSPKYRHKGIASALVDYVLSDAKTEGYTTVEVYPHRSDCLSPEHYQWLLKLYVEKGFVTVSQQDDCAILQKKL